MAAVLENTSVYTPAAVWQLLSTTRRGIGSATLSRSASAEAPTSCRRPRSSAKAIKPSPRSGSNPPCPMKWNTWQPPYSASCAASQLCPTTQSTVISPRACNGASTRCSNRRCSASASRAARSPGSASWLPFALVLVGLSLAVQSTGTITKIRNVDQGDEVALQVEGVVNCSVNAQEALGRSRRLEPLQLALTSSDRLMRILRPIVLSEPLLMQTCQTETAQRRSVGAQLVGDQQFGSKPLLF